MNRSIDTEAEIRETIENLQDAINRKDAQAAIANYGKGYVNFSLAPPLIDKGSSAEDMNAWFDTWEGPLRNEIRDLTVASAGDVAFAHSLSRMRGHKKGQGDVELWFRQTIGLRKLGHAWKIVHEHASVPFYMDGSMKAAVDLKP